MIAETQTRVEVADIALDGNASKKFRSIVICRKAYVCVSFLGDSLL